MSAPPAATRPEFPGVPFELINGEVEILPGIRGLPTPGHVPFSPVDPDRKRGEKACFVADLVPTAPTCRCRGLWATTAGS